MKLRRIQPLDIGGIVPADLSLQKLDFDFFDPRDMWVEEAAQREFVKKSKNLALQIVADFKYANLVVPTGCWVDGKLLVLNGQTTVIACASHPDIKLIPVLIVEAPELQDRARAFVSHSRDRVAATPGQIWRGLVSAGDEEATTILRVCEAAGIKLLPYPPPGAAYRVRETVALAAIKKLIVQRGPEQASVVLAALADSDLAPITADSIRVADTLLNEPEYAADFDCERVAASFRALGSKAVTEAKELAAAKELPMWRALVAVIYRHRKGRGAAPATQPLPMRRVIDRTPPSGPVSLGDPAPGRSALDQRRISA